MKIIGITKLLIILYFINLFLYSFFSLLNKEEVTEIFWFIRVPILLLLYFVSSEKRNILYFGGLILYQLASVFYRLELPHAFIYATVFSMLFKLCLVLLVLDLVRKSNYKAICIAFIPFFVIYLYIIEFVVHELGDSYYIWIVNALLTSFIGSVAIINYVNEPKHRNYWLLISSVLFIIQIGAFFINKFYIRNEGIYQMVILAYGISHYTFYKFMILKEMEME
ncbi:hypothetical protein FCR2A7T_05850 [Flavobacterium cauense R2A-7]|uniref:YhhN-like protein n=1 Tax=Flavobacterium cauense R2A-7 TaxID=1341154 RepID=V6S3M6_9FLAO|nr:hypothetical protein FCR2A7T_05850 [Flavobacterium cauense R2A-7]KGO80062.1 hypothetical protein Q762_13285 [Flavobacterium cauense R2A-7]TWI09001.1 hypothetical protein IP98_02715 [Flavobacterium cauense R2A-7]